MKKPETVMEWFRWADAIGYEWAKAAIANVEKYAGTGQDTRNGKVETLAAALFAGFVWADTQEGLGYWIGIHDDCLLPEWAPSAESLNETAKGLEFLAKRGSLADMADDLNELARMLRKQAEILEQEGAL